MKNYTHFIFALIFLAIFKPNVYGQQSETDLPHSTIFLVRTSSFVGSAVASYILFPNQQRFALPVGSVVEYKIYSEGEISIAAEYVGGTTLYYNLNAKRGNQYYVYLALGKFSEINKTEIQKIIDKPKNFAKREENLDFPINKSSLKDIKKGGKGQGTCFLISSSGYFITNFHCVENCKEMTIKGIDGDFTTKYEAILIASDPSNDLALLKITNKNLKFSNPPFAMRTNGIAQAEKIFALGFPNVESMGKEMKITDGIISAKSGAGGDISKFQISAAVNPGNSGGPLMDEDGNLIGVIYAKSTIAESAGYAVKAGYLETFLKNVDGFEYPILVNTLKGKPLTEKIAELKNYIYILEIN